MKKTGQFFFIFVPLILTTLVQYLSMLFLMGISSLVESGYFYSQGYQNAFAVYSDLVTFWSGTRFNTAVMLVYALINLSVFAIWYYVKYDGCFLIKPHTVFHPLSVIGILMLVPGLQYLSNYIVTLTATLFPRWLEVYEDLLETAGLDDTMTVSMFLYSVILGPISEELVFRGVTMRQAEKCLPFWLANLMQALLFGIFHMNMIQGVYAFCLGLFFGYICKRGGSIYLSILLHMLFNFWGTVISQFLYYEDSSFSFLFWFLFAIVMTSAGVLVFTAGANQLSVKKAAAE